MRVISRLYLENKEVYKLSQIFLSAGSSFCQNFYHIIKAFF